MEDLEADESLHINELPDIPLRRIFSFLPILDRLEVEKVCKRWCIIGKEGWPNVKKLEIKPEYSDDIILLILKHCGRFLKELTFHEIPELLNVLSMIIKFCELNQLESIHICVSDDSADNDVELVICQLRKIFGKAAELVNMRYVGHLGLYGTDWFSSTNLRTLQRLLISNSSVERLSINPDRFPNLKKLHLEDINIVGGEMREEQSLKGLEIMEIYECDIPQDFIQRIGTFENLQTLTLRNNDYNMSNEHIRNIALHCCKLEDMYLTCTPNMTSECFKYLGLMPSLEALIFKELNNVKSHDIAYLKNVNYLSFGACSGDLTGDGSIELIAESTNLSYLTLSTIPLLNMTFLNDFRQIFHRNQREKRLHLDVHAISWNNEVTPVGTDHPLLKLGIFPPDES